MNEVVLSTHQLTKNYGKLCAVNQLNLEVKRGQIFGMLGPNGSGKTTTLGMLMGVTNPSSGSFSWFGEPATHHTRKKIGAVLEHPIFYPYLSGQKNLELNAMIKGADPKNIPKVLKTVDLTLRKDDKYRTYSLGREMARGTSISTRTGAGSTRCKKRDRTSCPSITIPRRDG